MGMIDPLVLRPMGGIRRGVIGKPGLEDPALPVKETLKGQLRRVVVLIRTELILQLSVELEEADGVRWEVGVHPAYSLHEGDGKGIFKLMINDFGIKCLYVKTLISTEVYLLFTAATFSPASLISRPLIYFHHLKSRLV